MSFPPPPGLKQAPSSLPPRPPPSTNAAQPPAGPGYGGNVRPSGYSAFTAFAPRSVASTQSQRTASPVISAPPVTSAGYAAPATNYGNYYQQPQTYQNGPSYYGAPYSENTYGPTIPQIQNPFGSTPGQPYGGRRGREPGVDAETEAQIAQWQSAYANPGDEAPSKRRDGTQSATGTATGAATPVTGGPGVGTPVPQPESQTTVTRSGGGQNWTDSTLLEWDPAHFRLFVGNLAGEVTDDSLLKAFARYPSVQKARVIREKRTQKSKGYGFVSFSNGDDYFSAAREMQGKYIGSHPVLLRRATTEVRPVSNNKNSKKGGGGARGGGPPGGKVKHDGVKKPGKTKGGLKILG
ncbi:uncharacterized protein N7459_001276 [Penicillium hispanicum]|uniref:uncharacterized protein n=1 Tax=Penicillium hispanicum TaxID=1080232 RepID=UPI0025419AF9|nr:uncharacterized protein N7459_001276 [Penicillium hispanicum]KAJ5595068.1 hypothetical protein N7459_001276 [Penicillium hispanicum]